MLCKYLERNSLVFSNLTLLHYHFMAVGCLTPFTISSRSSCTQFPSRIHKLWSSGSISILELQFPARNSTTTNLKFPYKKLSPNDRASLCRRNRFRLAVKASNSTSSSPPPPNGQSNTRLLVCSIVTFVLAIANRVLYKLALVPLKEYPFFLAQFITFGYVVIYFSVLYTRYRAGIVTDEMIAFPKNRFMAIGVLEALGVVAGMSSAAMLPGPAIPILNQTFLVWQLALSTLILGRRYSFRQITGCLLVASGVILAVASGSDAGQTLAGISSLWPVLMIVSSAFMAGASILKESIFLDAAKRLKGKSIDIFVVNSFGSGFQALFVLLFLPLLSNLRGIPFTHLPSYLKSGAACFLNIGGSLQGCQGAPLLPILYVVTNMAFNISALYLVKISTAVISSLSSIVSVPFAIYILSLPLPYLPGGASLSPFFLLGSTVLLLGLVVYNLPQPLTQEAS